MNILLKNIEFFFIINIINCLDIYKLWESEKKVEDYSFLKIDAIDSISIDTDSNTELVLEKKANPMESRFFLLKDKQIYSIINNTLGISKIVSPLIEFNKNINKKEIFYYFCSENHKQVLSIKKDKLEEITNTNDNALKASRIKCFSMYNYMAVMYLNTHSFYTLKLNKEEYELNTKFKGNYEYLAINQIEKDRAKSSFVILRTKDNLYNVSTVKYNYTTDDFEYLSEVEYRNDLHKFYSNIEITPIKGNDEAIIFTYNSNDKIGGKCIFYRVNYKEKYFQINGLNSFLGYLNNSEKINMAGFIGNSTLLLYSIINNRKEYIGVADLYSLITIFHSQINTTKKIYVDYGQLFQNKGYINYIENNTIIKYCPFIKENEFCLYYVNKSNNYFYIYKENTFYVNRKVLECNGKTINKFYCLDNCPIGYFTYRDTCINCFNNIKEKDIKYYSYMERHCIDNCNEPFNTEDNICFDCRGEKPMIYEDQCIGSCNDIQAITTSQGICYRCKDDGKYYYKNPNSQNGECIEKEQCDGKINEVTNECIKCQDNNLKFIPLINECIQECPNYFIEQNNRCELCSKETYFFNKECLPNCSIGDDQYGMNYIELETININERKFKLKNSEKINYCERCDYFKQKDYCVKYCDERYYEQNNTCKECPEEKYLVKNIKKDCLNECPKNSKTKDNFCIYCENSYYYNNSCVQDCGRYELFNYEDSDKIKYCKECDGIIIDGKCENKTICEENNRYINYNHQCKQCLCANNQNIRCNSTDDFKYKCDCSEDKYSYGFFCEFFSEVDIHKNGMYIISLYNNRLIRTQKNYFTYKLTDNLIILNNNYSFDWKIYFNNEEITNNKIYEKFFCTGTKDAIFGINKELFDFALENEKTVNISLSIKSQNKEKKSYQHKITLRLINYEKLISNSFELIHEGEQINREMSSILTFNTHQNFKINNNMQYYFQYEFLDYFNERFPLTSYSDLEEIKFYSPYMNGFYINAKNDKDEITSIFMPIHEITSLMNISFVGVQELENYSFTEKIYILISKLRNYKQQLRKDEMEIIHNFTNDYIVRMNENGYYNETYFFSNNNESKESIRNVITYSEPKLIFALINYVLISQKEYLTKDDIDKTFFNYFNSALDKIINKEKISNKAFSDSDIKSIFRTLDNLYDIVIRINNNTDSDKLINNEHFIKLLNKICEYLSYITYPSELVKLVGKRISLLNFHLSEHQNYISFPFIDNMEDINLNNFLNYAYDNYYLDEKICSQKNSTFLCITEKNLEKLKNYLISKNYNLNNINLNIFLLQDITKENQIKNDDSEDDEYKMIFKNYSFVLKLYNKEKKEYISLDNENILFDVEFYYRKILDKDDEENKTMDSSIEKFYKSKNLDIPLYPNNSKIVCIPKNFNFNNSENYFCKTHFNYDDNKVRCTCNITDEIIVIKNSTISNYFKEIQFQKRKYDLINIYSSKIILLIILLFLIPSIYYLFIDLKESSHIKSNNEKLLCEIEDNRKDKYKQIKKYYNTGIFLFALYLTLNKFPYFTIFNKYKLPYPKYIKYLVIYIGILLGFCFPLIPFNYIDFDERQIFIDQRDIKYDDTFISDIGPSKYYYYFIFYGFIGLISSHIFIFIFYIFLGYYKEESDIWLHLKTLCKDYVYYEIKSEVLLGNDWKKIRLRISAFYYICGSYILKTNKRKNKKIKEYLKYISRNIEITKSVNDLGAILPESRNSSIYDDINDNNKTLELIEKNPKALIINDDENSLINIKIKKLNNKHINSNFVINKIDNFILNNRNEYDKSKRRIQRFEKIKNKYIYKLNKDLIKEMENNKEIIDLNENKYLNISHEINFSFYPVKSFLSLNELNIKANDSNNKIKIFILITIILWILFIGLAILTLFLIQKLLDKFDRFIIKAWIIPISIIIIIINFVLYYLKMLVGTLLLFYCYSLRKKKYFYKCLFWVFVDKSMINIYKVRNLITKYKKEFDYL